MGERGPGSDPESKRGPRDGEPLKISDTFERVGYKFRGVGTAKVVGVKVPLPAPSDTPFQTVPFYTDLHQTVAPVIRIHKPDTPSNPPKLLMRDYVHATNQMTGGRIFEPVPKSHGRPKDEDGIDFKINVKFLDGEKSMDGVAMTEIVAPDKKTIVRFPTAVFLVPDSSGGEGTKQRQIRQIVMEAVVEGSKPERKIYIPAELVATKTLEEHTYVLKPIDKSFKSISRPVQSIPPPEITIEEEEGGDESGPPSRWKRRLAIAALVVAAIGGGTALVKADGCSVAPDSNTNSGQSHTTTLPH